MISSFYFAITVSFKCMLKSDIGYELLNFWLMIKKDSWSSVNEFPLAFYWDVRLLGGWLKMGLGLWKKW